MSTILHLTDLHLGDRDANRTSIDDKTSNTASAQEGTRLAALKETLTELAAGMDAPPDCVVISGDITSAGATSGYQRLEEVLEALGSKRPAANRILVVPGNHDVDWDANPGRAKKYTRFKRYVVNEGYVTPLLEGVHLNVDGTARSATPPPGAPSPILELDDAVVVAVNSSNFCGTRPALTDEQKSYLDSYLEPSLDRTVAETDLERLGVFDMARISTGQLQTLTNELATVKGDERIRICVLHHQLTPVSDREEIKPFETITNLGQFREWLVQHRFSVVLHGHKHESALLWDYLPPADDPLGPPVRVLVSAGPSPQFFNDPVGRILELGAVDGRPFVPGAPHARIKTFNACRTGGTPTVKVDEVSLDRDSPQPAADNAFTVIRSSTVQDAYEKLRHRVRRAHLGRLYNVMCVVDEPGSAVALPEGYDAPANWLNDTVRWWQLPSSRLVAEGKAPFNHGERLYGGGNPLKLAAKRLGSTKAMVCLVRPDEPVRGAKFPAFVAVQLVQRQTPEGLVVDCIGIFRKQELKHWWPVNMAELHTIQLAVIEHADETKRPAVGRLISFAVEALDDDVRPQLAGTVLDRHADLAPDRLAELAFYAYLGAPADAAAGTSDLWKAAFADLADADTDEGLPSLGLQELVRYARLLQGYQPTEKGEYLRDALKDLLGAASDGAKVTDGSADESRERRERIARQVEDILDAVEAMPGGGGTE